MVTRVSEKNFGCQICSLNCLFGNQCLADVWQAANFLLLLVLIKTMCPVPTHSFQFLILLRFPFAVTIKLNIFVSNKSHVECVT